MSIYSDDPAVEAVVLLLRDDYQAALEAWLNDPTEENSAVKYETAEAFANARTSAQPQLGATPVIGGDAVQDGVN